MGLVERCEAELFMGAVKRLRVGSEGKVKRPGVWLSADEQVVFLREGERKWRVVAASCEAEYWLSRFELHRQRFVTRREAVESWALLAEGEG